MKNAYAGEDMMDQDQTASILVNEPNEFNNYAEPIPYYTWATGVLVPLLVAVIGYMAVRNRSKKE
ncbi:MAG: hypothetical protein DRI65_04395 [Chloroflexota bacterium]|nr:MAG: hypothetical protein DRI65_04395 [Chloroflexota bacterium]